MDRNELARIIASLTDEEFAEITAQARPDLPPKGVHVPNIGQQPTPRPTSGADAIRIAEEAGDWVTAGRLKTARLIELASPHRRNES